MNQSMSMVTRDTLGILDTKPYSTSENQHFKQVCIIQ